MKLAIQNENLLGAGDQGLRRAYKWVQIRKGVHRFRSHEDADAWWLGHYLDAYRRAKAAGSDDLSFLRQLLESQGITPPE